MSRQLALDTVHLRPTPRLAHTEYSLGYHHEYLRKVTGLDAKHPDQGRRFNDLWGIDFNWNVNDGLHGNWGQRGRATDMGHAVYAADGSDLRQPKPSPFTTAEEVWAFDAVKEYGLPDRAAQIAAYEKFTRDTLAGSPDQLTTGGYYKTIISGAIAAFGWDMLLLAAAQPRKFEPVLDSLFRYTLFHMECWAETSIEVIIQHDDFVWSEGPFMNPEIYRKVIIPRFARLWAPLRAKGKKVLFCSDGLFTMFAEDIIKAGADGLIFEPCNDFGWMVERFGQTSCLVGSAVDCRDMSFRPWPVVKATMDRTLALAKQCKGLIWAVGNHIPANVPDDMLDRYIAYLRANWAR